MKRQDISENITADSRPFSTQNCSTRIRIPYGSSPADRVWEKLALDGGKDGDIAPSEVPNRCDVIVSLG